MCDPQTYGAAAKKSLPQRMADAGVPLSRNVVEVMDSGDSTYKHTSTIMADAAGRAMLRPGAFEADNLSPWSAVARATTAPDPSARKKR